MSVAADRPETGEPPAPTTGSAGAAGSGDPTPGGEACPLCGAPLDPEQQWCLRCGAAARTRLAASSSWKAPIVAVVVAVALSLGVLAAALIKLAGDSSSPATLITSTVTAAPAVTTPTTTTPQASTPSVTSPGTTPPGPGTASGPLSVEPKVTPPSHAPSKLLIKDLITGTGAEAKAGERLTVNYVGVLFHGGQEFDSSWKRGQRFKFTLGTGQVIVGWDQGVPGMRVGGRRELIVPATLAYGTKGSPTSVPIPPNETLVFVVDLLRVRK